MRRRGFTLIELTIALAIFAMVTATAVAGMNSLTHAHLRSTAVKIAGAVKMSYDRAVMERRTQRLVLDMDKNTVLLEFTESPFALARERAKGSKGVTPDDPASADASRDRSSKKKSDSPLGGFDLEAGEGAKFVPDDDSDLGRPFALPSGIRLTRVWTGSAEEAFTSGQAYLNFFSGGYTEPAIIELSDENDEVVTLKVLPLTGRVRSYDKKLETPKGLDLDREAGEE